MNLRPKFFIFALILISSVSAAQADTFRWVDKDGVMMFGNNPPKDALVVEKLAGKKFSHYSGHAIDRSGRSRTKRARLNTPKEITPPPKTKVSNAKLEQGRLSVRLNEYGQISLCKVSVQNKSDSDAKNVLVSFEFANGLIVPGSGPDTILGRAQSEYVVADQHLPVHGNVNGIPSDPKVIIQFSDS